MNIETQPRRAAALGIDVGTTTLSVRAVSLGGRAEVVWSYDLAHGAGIPEDGAVHLFPGAYAQDAEALVSRAVEVTDAAVSACDIRAIGITGQMHGVLCVGGDLRPLSPLYTWQNEYENLRAPDLPPSSPTLGEEIRAAAGHDVPTGYGFATLYCLRRLGALPEETACAATAPDYLAMRLCGRRTPLCHPTLAASLGCYDVARSGFDRGSLEKLGMSGRLIPELARDFEAAGAYRGIPVAAAIGDNQASVFGSLKDDGEVLINVGTSSQVSVICGGVYPGAETRPYFGGRYLRIGAGLCGGRAYAALADFILSARGEKTGGDRRGEVYAWLNGEAAAAKARKSALTFSTRFCGTREDPSVRGGVSGLGLDNFTPGDFAYGVLRGITDELADMYRGVTSFEGAKARFSPVFAGSALRRNPVLRDLAEERFGEARLPRYTGEAAAGAALYAAVSAGLLSPDGVGGLV